jgi:hypothetical protein
MSDVFRRAITKKRLILNIGSQLKCRLRFAPSRNYLISRAVRTELVGCRAHARLLPRLLNASMSSESPSAADGRNTFTFIELQRRYMRTHTFTHHQK